jgi:hypothetical protein
MHNVSTFLRRTRRVAPVMALFLALLTACSFAAQSSQQQVLEANRNAESREAKNYQPDSKTIQSATTANDSASNTAPKTQPPKTKRERLIDWLWRWLDPPNVASLLLFIVGTAGIMIGVFTLWAIRDQAQTAKEQLLVATSARLYVEGLTAVNFKPGQEPVFFLRIDNAGPVQAENVKVFIEVKTRHGESRPTGDGNAILIPANGHRDYDFRASFLLPQNMLELDEWNLTISGTVTHGDKQIPYCYKYNQWTGPRPSGVPTFVPCDYDPRRTVSATGMTESLGFSESLTASVVQEPSEGGPTTGTANKTENPRGHAKDQP